ncbi:acetate--CoA ligase family protein [Inhella gelatinilytica]|uniref:Acetate--CoA ligase family protein n=1 Tax=Inhella gelatinilytica TaxID=2795030 RepID=A0A931IV34_9BURK|nr:acetate--CoA ligase family protein [Inhella gelatinilytica]MBH9553327.1 acetate--CoA ligase family protein [Inhella gelatinilytica]
MTARGFTGLRWRGPLRVLDGSGHGVHQRVAVAELRLRLPEGCTPAAVQALTDWLEVEVSDPHPEATPPAPAAQPWVLAWLHRWMAAVQREQGVPVFGPCQTVLAEAAAADAADGAAWTWVLPVGHTVAFEHSLAWALRQLGTVLDAPKTGPEVWAPALQALRQALRPCGVGGTNVLHFLAAARELKLEAGLLVSGVHAFGLGAGARWLSSTITDRTPSLGVSLARSKLHTATVLRRAGLPAPQHRLVRDEAEAVQAAGQLGWPIVVKPNDQDQGRGVFTELATEAQVRAHYREARQHSAEILIERHCRGEDYRLTVVQGQLIKVMHRRPAQIVGTGEDTVAVLVERLGQTTENLRAFRRSGTPRVSLDAEALDLLAEQGLAPDTVLAAGQAVRLRRKANISTGGTHALVPLSAVHPDNVSLAVRAAAALRLDLAGIDLIAADIAQPWHAQEAVICEVNAQPQLGYRDTPGLYRDLLAAWVPPAQRVQVHVLLWPQALAWPTARHLQALAQTLGCTAWSAPGHAWSAGQRLGWPRPAPATGAGSDAWEQAQVLLQHPALQAAVLVLSDAEVLGRGLPTPWLQTLLLPDAAAGLTGADRARWHQACTLAQPHAARVQALQWTQGSRL